MSAGKCRRKFRASFQENLLQVDKVYSSKLKTRESLLDKKPDRKVSVLTELKLDGTGDRLETLSRKIS